VAWWFAFDASRAHQPCQPGPRDCGHEPVPPRRRRAAQV